MKKLNIETFLLFVGYGRSGHSAVASLLNTHPNILISDEIGILKKNRTDRNLIINEVINYGRKHPPKYNSIQKNVKYVDLGIKKKNITVIGDKHANQTTRYISREPQLLENFKIVMKDVRMIHVIRNPYDIITTKFLRKKSIRWQNDINNVIREYSILADTVAKLKENGENIFDIRLEDLIYEPEKKVSEMFDYVGVAYNSKILRDCTSILLKTPNKSRRKLNWTGPQIGRVKRIINKHDFLKGYSFRT